MTKTSHTPYYVNREVTEPCMVCKKRFGDDETALMLQDSFFHEECLQPPSKGKANE